MLAQGDTLHQTVAMLLWCAFVGADFGNPPAQAPLDTQVVASPATGRQLSGLSAEEADALVGKLQDAQRRLRAGDNKLVFELVSGSLACYEMAKLSAHDAFLRIPFEKAWNIQRVKSGNRLWQPFKLSYAPNGLGQLYWEIEVVLGFNGNIERVLMVYKPPAPF